WISSRRSRTGRTNRNLDRQTAMSAACQSVDLGTVRGRMSDPGLATIQATVNFAAISGARHPFRLPLVKGQCKHRELGPPRDVDTSPAVATVVTAEQHPDLALETASPCHPELARSARHLANVAAIDLSFGVERLQGHVPPMVSIIGAVEHAGSTNAKNRA